MLLCVVKVEFGVFEEAPDAAGDEAFEASGGFRILTSASGHRPRTRALRLRRGPRRIRGADGRLPPYRSGGGGTELRLLHAAQPPSRHHSQKRCRKIGQAGSSYSGAVPSHPSGRNRTAQVRPHLSSRDRGAGRLRVRLVFWPSDRCRRAPRAVWRCSLTAPLSADPRPLDCPLMCCIAVSIVAFGRPRRALIVRAFARYLRAAPVVPVGGVYGRLEVTPWH